jgi:hypothetical protein
VIVAALMMSAARQAHHEPLWFVVALSLAMLAFCVWGFIALARLKRDP